MKRAAIIIAGLALGAVLLALDLRAQGAVWQFLYGQTGEEDIIGQARGLVELGGNLARQPLRTAPLLPVAHTDEAPYGINVFLQKEVEEPKIRAMLQMIRDAGFVWLRQEFPWEDLEVDGKGQFTDTRNDYTGDGIPDTISAWEKYDRIVNLAEEYGLKLMVRLSNPPDWAIAANPAKGTFAPPDDVQDFVDYAAAVAQRYRGRIAHYQIWNEPNIYPEWGEQFADPVAYTDMLCRTYQALKAIDPGIVVISAAIAPTISLDGYMGYQDIVYLQNMYDAGAAACFDVLSAQGYGLFSGPDDRRLRTTSVNMARHTYYRDIMVANNDAAKPIWISEAAWNAVLDAPLPPEQIADYARFGLATQAQAARYMPRYYQRAQQEWPWVGVIFYWFFTRPDPSEQGQSFYYFRMAEPDYSPQKPSFTPLPVYNAMRAAIASETPTLYQGVHQGEDWAIAHDGQREPAQGAQFGDAITASSAQWRFSGTDVWVRLRSASPVTMRVGDETLIVQPSDGWQYVPVFSSLLPAQRLVSLQAEGLFTLDSVTVADLMWHKMAVPLIMGLLGAGAALAGAAIGIRRRWGSARQRATGGELTEGLA
jgi:hypothetical protein